MWDSLTRLKGISQIFGLYMIYVVFMDRDERIIVFVVRGTSEITFEFTLP